MKTKVLLIEDEKTLAEIIAYALNEKGFEVITAYDGETGLKKFHSSQPDVIVTDVMMPWMDGFSLVKQLRESGCRTPVLFLTARSSVEDVVHGFELGGNDYLRKPFAMNELIVRIKALVAKNLPTIAEKKVYEIGLYRFDVEQFTLEKDQVVKKMSHREAEVLLYLCRNQNEVVPIKTLLLNLWGDDNYFNGKSLHVYITKLRNLLSADKSIQIVNFRGIGYKLLLG